MKRLSCLSILFLISTYSLASNAEVACYKKEYSKNFNKKHIIKHEDLIFKTIPVFPDGKIICDIQTAYFSDETLNARREEGIYKGIKYKVFLTDGSGEVQGRRSNKLQFTDTYGSNWSASCKFDEVADTHLCFIKKGEDLNFLYIGIDSQGDAFIKIGNENYPNSKVTVRVDKNPSITNYHEKGFDQFQIKEIINQFKKGNKAIFRYKKWPYNNNIDTEIDLFGFTVAMEILQQIHSKAAL